MWPILELAFRLEVSVTCYSTVPLWLLVQIFSVWAVGMVIFRVCPVRLSEPCSGEPQHLAGTWLISLLSL